MPAIFYYFININSTGLTLEGAGAGLSFYLNQIFLKLMVGLS